MKTTIFDIPLDGFDVLALMLCANMLTVWAAWGLLRLHKYDEWDWHSICAIGIPALIGMAAVYFGTN